MPIPPSRGIGNELYTEPRCTFADAKKGSLGWQRR